MDYLFVYGTLMRGYNHEMAHFLNNHSEFVGNAYFNGRLYEVAGFPGAVLSNNTSEKVYGQVFMLNDAEKVFRVLDVYEGIENTGLEPDLYKRLKVKTYLDVSEAMDVWVYIYNLPTQDLRLIPSGKYLE